MIGMPFYMPIWCLTLGTANTLVGIHNVHVPKGGTHQFLSYLYNLFTIRSFRYFHTFSKNQCDELLRIAPNKKCNYASLVPIDYGQATKPTDHEGVIFLSFGNIRNYKRVDVLICAAQRAYERTSIEFKVIIAGTCNDWPKYQKLIYHDHLFELDIRRIEDAEIPNLFASVDYFVAPYQDIAQSGAAVIAVNYEKPIVASRLPAFEEYIIDKETGFFIQPASVEDLTEKITYILKNHSRIYDAMKKNIHKLKETNFSIKNIASQYIMSFNNVLNGVGEDEEIKNGEE